MIQEKKSINWPVVLFIAVAITGISATAIFGPAVVQKNSPKRKVEEVEPRSSPITLQTYVEQGDFSFSDEKSKQSVLALLPYESISFERTPCFGPCPVYVMTFHRDGRATLVTDDWQTGKKYYTGKIWINQYIWLTQMVDLARKASHQTDYAGQWTDDYTATIRAKSKDQTWTVSDYGRVAPVEVWALETLLHNFREQNEWAPASGP